MDTAPTCPATADLLAYLYWSGHDVTTAALEGSLITPCVLPEGHPGSHVAFDGARRVEWDEAHRVLSPVED